MGVGVNFVPSILQFSKDLWLSMLTLKETTNMKILQRYASKHTAYQDIHQLGKDIGILDAGALPPGPPAKLTLEDRLPCRFAVRHALARMPRSRTGHRVQKHTDVNRCCDAKSSDWIAQDRGGILALHLHCQRQHGPENRWRTEKTAAALLLDLGHKLSPSNSNRLEYSNGAHRHTGVHVASRRSCKLQKRLQRGPPGSRSSKEAIREVGGRQA
ncbi:hypothetical protein BD289DRAFT_244851 [Coniella lustricola]|uniref:Uncharacterized protein n=1 Tax=Coniella lustricola TaxID=2025994 RepID=A0A2T3A914_9PEZI|nr:hypothetical protein BD289DRAFT_244851 [Coniella lustricola]